MKPHTLIITLLSAAAFAVGCKKEETASQQLDEASNATESTWNDVKTGFRKGYNELKDGFQQARQWVSDKIAP